MNRTLLLVLLVGVISAAQALRKDRRSSGGNSGGNSGGTTGEPFGNLGDQLRDIADIVDGMKAELDALKANGATTTPAVKRDFNQKEENLEERLIDKLEGFLKRGGGGGAGQ